MRNPRQYLVTTMSAIALLMLVSSAIARNPIRNAFFNTYPSVDGTQLINLPSNTDHCGVCHFDFNGGGPRNPYGAAIEAGRDGGLSSEEAILAIEGDDTDGDGFSNIEEILDLAGLYSNTPTFPGLTVGNLGSVSNVSSTEVAPHVTPTSGVDTTPPTVTVLSPDGGESITANLVIAVTWDADDASGIASIDIHHSDDGGSAWKPIVLGISNSGSFNWFVPHRPGSINLIRVTAVDGAGNSNQDESGGSFTINGLPAGYVPTTLRDMDMPGTQPLEGPTLADADANCATCHGNYDIANEPWSNWRGSMMAQSARDPLFYACLAVAEQDAPSVGDLCLRCHTPRGWLGGRSIDTSGGSLTLEDRQGVSCDFCHKLVDWNYVPGVSPAEDQDILNDLAELPQQYGNGQYVLATTAPKRGPFSDALDTGHPVLESPFHRSSEICGTCHNVSNPVFDKAGPGDYAPNAFDAGHPTMNEVDMYPIERTYDEWLASDFASGGVSLPQYGGVVSTCQDCHMSDVTAAGCNDPLAPIRTDMPLHDMTGGNAFIQDLIPDFFPTEVDVAQLQASKARAITTLQKAARLELTGDGAGVTVRVYNDTGHKLPTGYPEGRRMWLQIEATDDLDNVVYTSGSYDASTGVLTHDADIKLYEVKPGLSPALASALGLPAGPSFHFVLNDSTYQDNRIPPRGFTNAVFDGFGMPVVAYSYADGQYWDDTFYALPNTATSVTARLLYQTVSKEYIEFLRDENTTNSAGLDLYNSWASHGRGAPVLMAEETIPVNIVTAVGPERSQLQYSISRVAPNPFRNQAIFQFALPTPGGVKLEVFDLRGRRVRLLENEIKPAGTYSMRWDGLDDHGKRLASGVYFLRYQSGPYSAAQRVTLLR